MTQSIEERRLQADAIDVGALLIRPPAARAAFVFAHGAGAGMRHAFMATFAEGLAELGVATLRYQFPFMERGSKRTDRPAVAHAAVRAACAMAIEACPDLPLFAGGKSFGGRMTSQAQAVTALAGVRGLVFVGFPLHPPDKPSTTRADHLADVRVPMLFLQGTRDELADLPLVEGVVAALGPRARLETFDDADHAFHVRKSSGTDDAKTMQALLQATIRWMDTHAD